MIPLNGLATTHNFSAPSFLPNTAPQAPFSKPTDSFNTAFKQPSFGMFADGSKNFEEWRQNQIDKIKEPDRKAVRLHPLIQEIEQHFQDRVKKHINLGEKDSLIHQLAYNLQWNKPPEWFMFESQLGAIPLTLAFKTIDGNLRLIVTLYEKMADTARTTTSRSDSIVTSSALVKMTALQRVAHQNQSQKPVFKLTFAELDVYQTQPFGLASRFFELDDTDERDWPEVKQALDRLIMPSTEAPTSKDLSTTSTGKPAPKISPEEQQRQRIAVLTIVQDFLREQVSKDSGIATGNVAFILKLKPEALTSESFSAMLGIMDNSFPLEWQKALKDRLSNSK